jgi:hypothetical protein
MKFLQFFLFILTAFYFAGACQQSEKGSEGIEGVFVNEKTVGLESFRDRINWKASSVVFDASDWIPEESTLFNIGSFIESVECDTGVSIDANLEMEEGQYIASSEKHIVTIVGKGNRILVEDKEEAGLLYLENASEPALDSLELLSRSKNMASGLGAIEDQMGQADIREVLAMNRPEEGSSEPDTGFENKLRVSTKVFFYRVIGALKVATNRLVFTYANSGELLRIRGRWVEVDYEASQMKSDISLESYILKAKDELENRDVNIDTIQGDIYLRTYFKDVITENGVHLLDMVGGVFYRATDETGEPNMGVELEFDI